MTSRAYSYTITNETGRYTAETWEAHPCGRRVLVFRLCGALTRAQAECEAFNAVLRWLDNAAQVERWRAYWAPLFAS